MRISLLTGWVCVGLGACASATTDGLTDDETSSVGEAIAVAERADFVEARIVYNGVWGTWQPRAATCRPGTYATQMTLRALPPQGAGFGPGNDDTGLEAIALLCATLDRKELNYAIAHPGRQGSFYWDLADECPSGAAMNGMRARAEAPQGSDRDDAAVTDADGKCTDGSPVTPLGGLYQWGTQRPMVSCPEGTGICGINVRYEEPIVGQDNTGLNGIQVSCCTLPGVAQGSALPGTGTLPPPPVQYDHSQSGPDCWSDDGDDPYSAGRVNGILSSSEKREYAYAVGPRAMFDGCGYQNPYAGGASDTLKERFCMPSNSLPGRVTIHERMYRCVCKDGACADGTPKTPIPYGDGKWIHELHGN